MSRGGDRLADQICSVCREIRNLPSVPGRHHRIERREISLHVAEDVESLSDEVLGNSVVVAR
jgi:hypothetical protein